MNAASESEGRTSELAVVSLVLSLPCVIAGPLALLPLSIAIIALVRISRSEILKGKLIAGCAIVLSLIGLASTKLYINAREKAEFHFSQTLLRSIASDLGHYVSRRDGYAQLTAEEWPDLLIENGILDPEKLIAPREDGDGISYIYLENYVHWDEESIMLYEDPKHWKQGVIVAFGDQHVEVLPHDEFHRRLEAQMEGTP